MRDNLIGRGNPSFESFPCRSPPWHLAAMNYRHAFHAGGFADVVKHALLVQLILHLRKKETPFCVLDTHAGVGRYDLAADEAARTGEAEDGVLRLIGSDTPPAPALADYLDCLKSANPSWPALRIYPGSPAIARAMLRPQDRLVAVELHPEDSRALKRVFAGDRQVSVHEGDGYLALRAHLPPRERRGLVLIDPPYEDRDEFKTLAKALPEAIARFRTGIFAIWYPIKDTGTVARFHAELAALGRPTLAAEFLRFRPDDPTRLNGTGLAIVNPPWQFDAAAREMLAALAERLGAAGGVRLLELGAANAI
jgi:23S rRNA (adenine2030-N6)-methyltransferase